MSNFIFEKASPILLALFGISCIDTPHNFVRRVLYGILDIVHEYFGQIFHSLT